jgi:hypothetical protein
MISWDDMHDMVRVSGAADQDGRFIEQHELGVLLHGRIVPRRCCDECRELLDLPCHVRSPHVADHQPE